MAFPLMVHMNSTRRALAPAIFFPMLYIEIFLDAGLLCALPFVGCAVIRAAVLHPNFRLINLSMIVHYASGILARFVIIYYERNDLPVKKSDWIILGADIVRDQMLGFFISLLGVFSFERYIATRRWKWYESRHRATLWIVVIAELLGILPSLVNVLLCEYDYYPHEVNFVIYGFVVFASGILYLIAYIGNTRELRSLSAFTSTYTISQLFQFTAILMASTLPVVALCFGFFGVFFFAPSSWERARFLSIALVDFSISVYMPFFFLLAVRGMPEYHREIYKIRLIRWLTRKCGWKVSSRDSSIVKPAKVDEAHAYFNGLSQAWA